MGFGTLFIGYFLLLNITYFSFTDAICALVMALAFNKLTSVNKYFKFAFFGSVAFAVIGAIELIWKILSTFIYSLSEETLFVYTSIPRYLIIGFVVSSMLLGIENVSREVGLSNLREKTRHSLYFTAIVYTVGAIIEIPGLEAIIPLKILAYIGVFFLLALLIVTSVNLVNIYSAYMRICMPSEIEEEDTPSRFGFINKFREHEKEKQREYVEYKLGKLNNKKRRNKNGKKQ